MDNLPDDEEIDKINGWLKESEDNALDKMERVDQFFYIISTIPKFRDRMETFLIISNFPSKYEDITNQLTLLKHATTDIRIRNKNFNKLLEIVWAFGNFLNSGTNRGNAPGFSIRSLLKIKDIKSNEGNKMNLLNYLVEYIYENNEEILEWTNELKGSKFAKKVSYQTLMEEANELQKKSKILRRKNANDWKIK